MRQAGWTSRLHTARPGIHRIRRWSPPILGSGETSTVALFMWATAITCPGHGSGSEWATRPASPPALNLASFRVHDSTVARELRRRSTSTPTGSPSARAKATRRPAWDTDNCNDDPGTRGGRATPRSDRTPGRPVCPWAGSPAPAPRPSGASPRPTGIGPGLPGFRSSGTGPSRAGPANGGGSDQPGLGSPPRCEPKATPDCPRPYLRLASPMCR